METHLDVDWDQRDYICLLLLPIILMGSIRNLKYISPFSVMAMSAEYLGRDHY